MLYRPSGHMNVCMEEIHSSGVTTIRPSLLFHISVCSKTGGWEMIIDYLITPMYMCLYNVK